MLLDGFQNSEAKATAQIPDQLLQKEKVLLSEITYLEKRISSLQSEMQQEENKTELQSILRDLQSQAFDAHQFYRQLVEELEQNYPDYYQIKYDSQTIKVRDLQSSLSDSQVLVNYFIGEKYYCLFVVTSGELEVQYFSKPTDFEASIQQFLQAIEEHNQALFLQKAHQLYQWLIQPMADFLFDPLGFEEELKELIVIPHAELNYLPFEALVCGSSSDIHPLTIREDLVKGYNDLDYLLHHCKISYQYSATLWHYLQARNKKHSLTLTNNHQTDFIGFAPIYETLQ